MTNRQRKLAKAVNVLSRYFGIHNTRDLAEQIAADSANVHDTASDGTGNDDTYPAARMSLPEANLINMLIDTSEGALLTKTFHENIEMVIDNDDAARTAFGKLLQMHYEHVGDGPGLNFVVPTEVAHVISPIDMGENADDIPIERVGVRQMLGESVPGSGQVRINAVPAQPTKEQPGLAVYVSNSPRVTLESQNTAATTIFLNGIPNIELARAVPYVNVEFFFPRPPKSSVGKQIQNLSLNKFLLGGVTPVEDSVLDIMVEADTVAGADISSRSGTESSPIPDRYSRAGMELFTSPQTLVNADDVSETARSNPVLDKFRPLMTLEDLSLTIEPSRGLMSFKRGTLSFILHDRSRLPEVAEFVRADLYGTNEITIEYGWSHPDGNSHTVDNPYGDLIDGMRIKEKYMVVNSSFNFDPSGQVSIKLNIAMRGATEFDTELMSTDPEQFSNIIREIETLQREIGELRRRAFPASTATTSVEIRGRQILDAAQDATSNPILSADLREALTEFRAGLRGTSNPSAQALLDRINILYGDQVQTRRQRIDATEEDGARRSQPIDPDSHFGRLRKNIQDSIRTKIINLSTTPDPFLATDPHDGGERRVAPGTDPQRRQNLRGRNRYRSIYGVSGLENLDNVNNASLAKVLLAFVGEPLALTGNYDEVQMFFYPFNEYAGAAGKINIANFIVDVSYFADELARYRLEHISRSSVMSLRQFMNFIADILLDDPAANSYGLTDGNQDLFRDVYEGSDDSNAVRSTTAVYDNPAEYQHRMESALQGVTPDGTFRMPQIGIHIEALPERPSEVEGAADEPTGRTILRLHVYDRTATAYESLGRLLLAARRNEIRSIGQLPNIRGGNQSVVDNQQEIASTTIAAAERIGLIEWIPSEPDAQEAQQNDNQRSEAHVDQTYRIIGGPKKLKEFIMNNSPYVIFGAAGTTVKNAQLASMQNSALATVNLIRSFQREEGVTPSGENLGGLPMQVIPTQLSMDCIGNPLLNFMQTYFVDFQTGTTADNLYAITGVEHKFTQGDFSTNVRFAPQDAWGTYRSLVSTIGSSLDVLRDVVAQEDSD